jgi:hypothetical protein
MTDTRHNVDCWRLIPRADKFGYRWPKKKRPQSGGELRPSFPSDAGGRIWHPVVHR